MIDFSACCLLSWDHPASLLYPKHKKMTPFPMGGYNATLVTLQISRVWKDPSLISANSKK